jgi:Na+/H+ antiporter
MSHGGSIHELELLLLVLLLFVVGLGTLAQRLKTPYPIVLVIGGLILSLVPHVPQFALNPDIVFLVLLPPLLFEASFNTSWRDFRHNLVSILLLAFGLVGFTAAGVALAAHWIIPGFDWRIGLVLGAVVSPTDALAATSIANRVHLPRRITEILEGESLVNDASGLILLQFAVTMVTSGVQPSVPQELAKLVWLTVGGVGIGILLGKIIYLFEGRVDNAPVEITASFLFPYLAYLAGEEIKASGILATVACGLFLGRRSSAYFSSTVRLQAWSTWNTLSYALNGIAFVLIGLQLREVLHAIQSESLDQLFLAAGVTIVVAILLRLFWVFPGSRVAHLVRRSLLKQTEPEVPAKAVFVVGWTGMRGVVSLAAAISLPRTLASGAPFPQRGVIIFITFCVIFITLVLQGLTLPAMIRALGLAGTDEKNPEEQKAKRKMLRAALEELDRLHGEDKPEFDSVYDDVARHYRGRLAALGGDESEEQEHHPDAGHYLRYRELTQQLRETERSTLIKLRDANEINDNVLRKLERELDFLDVRYQRR